MKHAKFIWGHFYCRHRGEIVESTWMVGIPRDRRDALGPLPRRALSQDDEGVGVDNGTDATMSRFRNYWYYSIGLAIAWAIVLTLVLTIRGPGGVQPFLLIFAGYCIGWVSTTIARFVYPPPARWRSEVHHA